MNPLNWLASRTSDKWHLLILCAFAFIVILLPAGQWDLRGPDEGRYAQVAKELLTRDNWLALTVMGKPYDQKPPLAFWLFAGALKLHGGEVHSGWLRMPSALAALGTLILTWLLGRRLGGPTLATLCAIILLTSFAFLDDAPTVELNMLFTFFITASAAAWLLAPSEKLSILRALAFWLLLAAAFLVKGPLAILVIFSALAAVAISARSWKVFRHVHILWGLPSLLIIIGIWFWGQSRAFGADFVEEQVAKQTVDRYLKGDHAQPFHYYIPRFFTAYMGPWAIAFLAGFIAMLRRRIQLCNYSAALLGWFAIPFFVLMLMHGKRVPYLLPLLPAASVIAACWLLPLTRQTLSFRAQRLFTAIILVFAIAIAGISAALLGCRAGWWTIGQIQIAPDIFNPWWAIAIIIASASTAIIYFWSERQWLQSLWAYAFLVLWMQLGIFTLLNPGMDPFKSCRPFASHVSERLSATGETTLATTSDLDEPEFHVYGNYSVRTVSKDDLTTSAPLPKVLALKGVKIEKLEPAALAAGYQQVSDEIVTKEQTKIYVRNAP